MSSSSTDFLGVLRCPVTRVGLRRVELSGLRALGVEGEGVRAWEAGLLREDGRGVYPVIGGIPVLMAEAMRVVGAAGAGGVSGGEPAA